MDMFIRLFCVVIAVMVIGVEANGQTFPEPRTLKINERVYVLLGPIQHANKINQGYMINSTVIVGDKGVILIDSGGSDEVGQHIATAVRRITEKPVTHVVNTHHHGDHYLGNVAFEGATFISSAMCRKMVLDTGHEWLEIMERDIGHKLPGTKPLAASVTYAAATRTETTIHGVRVAFWVPKGSHTIGDLMVHLPDDKVLDRRRHTGQRRRPDIPGWFREELDPDARRDASARRRILCAGTRRSDDAARRHCAARCHGWLLLRRQARLQERQERGRDPQVA